MRRTGAAALGMGLLLAAAAGIGLAQQRLNGPGLRQAVIASVERQSGRAMTLGRIRLRLLPTPRVQADDLALGGPPGAVDAEMLRIGHLEAGIGIWPLLDHVVRLHRLTLDRVTLHAARDAAGHGNWEMGARPSGSGGGAAGRHRRPWGVELGTVTARAVRISWRDALLHQGADLQLSSLSAAGLQGSRPRFDLAGTRDGAGYAMQGSTGPVRRLFDRGASGGAPRGGDRRTPWPVSMRGSETIGGAVVGHGRLDGTITDPAHGRGYDLEVAASLAQLADLDRLFPHAGLPRMQGLELSAHVLDHGGPVLAALRAKAGATAVRGIPDAALQGWSLAAATPGAPLDVAAWGSWRGLAVVLRGTAGSLRTVEGLRGDTANALVVPLRLSVGLADSAWRIEGSAGAGHSDLRVQGSVPDPRILSAAAPAAGALTLGARLQAQGGVLLRISDLQVTSQAGDLGGALTLSLRGRPVLSGSLRSSRLDVDWLDGRRLDGRRLDGGRLDGGRLDGDGLARRPSPPAVRGVPAYSGSNPGAAPAPRAAAPPPWPWLRLGDADLSLEVADLVFGGGRYHGFTGHAVLRNGLLLVDPFSAQGPDGPISARLRADAGASPPAISLWMHPVLLPASTLARLLGAPDLLRGSVQLVGQVQAAGADRHALVASATGHVGVSMVDGTISNAAMLRLVGPSSAFAAVLPQAGGTALRCLALHATLAGGHAAVDTLNLRSGRLSIDGHGRAGLQDGALDLHLVPSGAVGAAWVSLPMRVGGHIADPHPALDASAGGGRYALTIGAGGAPASDCAAVLRTAREDLAGPAASPPAPQDAGTRRKPPRPIDILRGLGILR